jgi:predicted acylesterase/phospholipase RssA
MDATSRPKRILYDGPSLTMLEGLCRAMAAVPGCVATPDPEPRFRCDGLDVELTRHADLGELVDDLHRSYVNLLLLDLRGDPAGLPARGRRALEVLDTLDRTEDVEDRYPFDRILALVSGTCSPVVDDVILQLGARGIGRVLRQGGEGPEAERAFGAEVLRTFGDMLRVRRVGRRALCAAGGGVTGIFFELGTLKCLDDCLGGGGVNDFDLYFGISAGAVVNAPLAAGYSVDEYMAAVAGEPGGRIPALDLRLFRLGHLDVPGFAKRARHAATVAWHGLRSVVRRGGRDVSRETLFFDYADLVAPPFRADRFETVMRGILEASGTGNDFRRLPRPLFVGATDQDARQHVLFGDEGHDTVPVSQAIQASLSINPAFSATSIEGRYYEDGAVTRTSNFVEAIRRGADLVFVLDPFVPYVARTPGFTDRRGLLYNLDQDVRTISYTRYEATRNWVLRRHPEVSSYTFVPANRLRRLISSNPMDHRPYLEIWRGAYLSTLARVRHVRHRLESDLRAHGMKLDLARATEVGARLEGADPLRFSDFFPDGKVVLKRPLLVGDRSSRTIPPPPKSLRRFAAPDPPT